MKKRRIKALQVKSTLRSCSDSDLRAERLNQDMDRETHLVRSFILGLAFIIHIVGLFTVNTDVPTVASIYWIIVAMGVISFILTIRNILIMFRHRKNMNMLTRELEERRDKSNKELNERMKTLSISSQAGRAHSYKTGTAYHSVACGCSTCCLERNRRGWRQCH